MKKVFALVLAVAMVMSMSAVSFAWAKTVGIKELPVTNASDKSNAELALYGPFRYDGDNHKMEGKTIQYGKYAYYLITYTGNALDNYNDIEKLKVKAKYEMGDDLVESVKIVKKNVEGGLTTNSTTISTVPTTTSKYAYFVEFKLKSSEATSDSDVVTTLTFNMKKNKDASAAYTAYEFDDADIDVAFTVFYENNWNDSGDYYLIDGDFESAMEPDTKYLLKFKEDDEVDLEFGLGQNEGTFTVDVSGQGKVVVNFNTKADEAIAAANGAAKMFFVNFNNIKFNRTGEFAYESEDFKFVYQIVDGKLTTIPTAEYDAADETIYFNTRVLGSYVFSDVELVDAPAAAAEAPAAEAPVENPTTGAAA